nr:hypothetical protein [Microctonus hyperodae filamentous virus]
METMDGSYAVGIETPRRNYYDIHHDLVTDEWTIPKKYNTRTTDFSTGPYHGVLIVDKHDRVVLAAFRENYYYIALHYLDHTGTWRWANNHNWPKLFNTSFDESKAVNSPQMKRCHGKHVHIF